jgi:hypothetical protein
MALRLMRSPSGGGMLSAGGNGSVYKNLVMTGGVGQGVVPWGTNMLFQNIEVHHTGVYCHSLGDSYCPSHGYHHAVYAQHPGDTITFDGCYIHDIPDGAGIQFYTPNVTVKNCRFQNIPWQYGIYAVAGGLRVQNSVFVDVGREAGLFGDGSSGGGCCIGPIRAGGGSEIYYNTFYHSNPVPETAAVYTTYTDTIIRNNLALNVTSGADTTFVFSSGGGTMDHNLCTVSHTGCTSTATVAATVVNAAAGDLHLTATSPAIKQAVAISGITTDKDGQPRNPPADLGAYEVVTGGPAPVPAPSKLRVQIVP